MKQKNDELLEACKNNNTEKVKELTSKIKDSQYARFVAKIVEPIPFLKKLFHNQTHEYPVNVITDNFSLLDRAVYLDNLEMVKTLVNCGAKISLQNLNISCESKDSKMFEFLLNKRSFNRSKIMLSYDFYTYLYPKSKVSHDIINILRPSASPKDLWPIMIMSQIGGPTSYIQNDLMSKRKFWDINIVSSFDMLVQAGQTDRVKEALARHDIKFSKNILIDSLYEAMLIDNAEIVEAILNFRDFPKNSYVIYNLARMAIIYDKPKVLEYILNSLAGQWTPKAPDLTPAKVRHLDILKMFRERNIEFDQYYAIAHGDLDVATYLIKSELNKNGIYDINRKNKLSGKNFLEYAILADNQHVIRWLVGNGAKLSDGTEYDLIANAKHQETKPTKKSIAKIANEFLHGRSEENAPLLGDKGDDHYGKTAEHDTNKTPGLFARFFTKKGNKKHSDRREHSELK